MRKKMFGFLGAVKIFFWSLTISILFAVIYLWISEEINQFKSPIRGDEQIVIGTRRTERTVTDSKGSVAERNNSIAKSVTSEQKYEIVHNNPSTLAWGKPTKFIFVIASKDINVAIRAVAKEGGRLEKEKESLGNRVRVELSGAEEYVSIRMVGKDERSVSSSSNTTFEWYLSPKTLEDFEIKLTVYNIHKIQSEIVETEGSSYLTTLRVNATFWQKLEYYGKKLNTWLALIGVSIVGVIAWTRGLILKIFALKANALKKTKTHIKK